jgi:hypothetical protein
MQFIAQIVGVHRGVQDTNITAYADKVNVRHAAFPQFQIKAGGGKSGLAQFVNLY